jgi:transposase InsO family protein
MRGRRRRRKKRKVPPPPPPAAPAPDRVPRNPSAPNQRRTRIQRAYVAFFPILTGGADGQESRDRGEEQVLHIFFF